MGSPRGVSPFGTAVQGTVAGDGAATGRTGTDSKRLVRLPTHPFLANRQGYRLFVHPLKRGLCFAMFFSNLVS
jgi:hypothetical protein